MTSLGLKLAGPILTRAIRKNYGISKFLLSSPSSSSCSARLSALPTIFTTQRAFSTPQQIVEPEPEGPGLFSSLSSSMNKIFSVFKGRNKLGKDEVEEAMRKLRMALIEADVEINVAQSFVNDLTKDLVGLEIPQGTSAEVKVHGIILDKLTTLLGDGAPYFDVSSGTAPVGVLMVGVQGSGKTTTCAKIALMLSRLQKKKVLLVSIDTHRPAAQDQLAKLASDVGMDIYLWDTTAPPSPLTIAEQAIQHARSNNYDIVIYDSAGRMEVDEGLMNEVAAVKEIIKPTETLLVADSLLGQRAAEIARSFHAKVPLTGIVLTRVDGDSKGGAALSIRTATGVPIKFMGVGERPEDIESFNPRRVAGRILGKADLLGLMERAVMNTDESDMKKLMNRPKKIDFEYLLLILRSTQKMGGLETMMSYMPGFAQKDTVQVNDIKNQMDPKETKKMEVMIQSMTKKERKMPEIIANSGSRKLRIANGSGTSVPEVNKLLKKLTEMRKVEEIKAKQLVGVNPNDPEAVQKALLSKIKTKIVVKRR